MASIRQTIRQTDSLRIKELNGPVHGCTSALVSKLDKYGFTILV
jgi:hypothetical protein